MRTRFVGLTTRILFIISAILTTVLSNQYDDYQQQMEESLRRECVVAPVRADGRPSDLGGPAGAVVLQQICPAAPGDAQQLLQGRQLAEEEAEDPAVRRRSLFLLSKLLGWHQPSGPHGGVNVNVNVQQKSKARAEEKEPFTVDVPVVLPAQPVGSYGTEGAVCTNCYSKDDD